MEQIKEFFANLDLKAIIDKIMAFVQQIVAQLMGGKTEAE